MIKKIFCLVFLLTLLVTLFLSSFSTSYALTLTENDIRNFCENSYKAKVNVNIPSTVEQNIATADFSAWVNAISSNEGRWAIFYSYGSAYLLVYNGSAANLNTYTMYKASNRIYVNTSYLSRVIRSCFSFSDGSFNNSSDIYDTSDFLYTDSLITNNGRRDGTVVYSAGTYKPNSDIFSGRYTNDYFEFQVNNLLDTVEVVGTEMPIIYNYGNLAQTFELGTLGLASNYQLTEIIPFRYTTSGWKAQLDSIMTYTNIGSITDNIINVTLTTGNFASNTIYQCNFYPDADSDFPVLIQPFYVGDRYTKIVNGVLVVDDTFSGDYFNNYNNDTNTDKIVDNNKNDSDKIVDTLTDDSKVDNILGEFISGDAEDIAEKFGFSLLNRYYYDFIHDTITDIVEVLEAEGDVYFDYSMHGEAPTRIYASDFTTPDGPLKTFLSMFLISCTVFAFYKYIADLIELISTGNILEALQEFKVDRNIFKM